MNQLVITFQPKAASASFQLMAWSALLTGDGSHKQRFIPTVTSHAEEVDLWLKQVLAFVLALLHAARIPVFGPIPVLSCNPDEHKPSQWQGVCQLPYPQLLPVKTMATLVSEAFQLAQWASAADIHLATNREHFFQQVESGAFPILAASRARGKSTFEMLRVAHSLGIPYRPLAGGVFQLGWGRHARRMDRSTTDHDSAMGMRWSMHKHLAAQMLREAGLPAPDHGTASSLEQAHALAGRIGFPVAVKPADMERGEGVTVDVHEHNLEAAFDCAYRKSPSHTVLVERQIPGVCHRLFIVAGELLYAVKRLPMGVYGDGRSSIDTLVATACAEQQKRAPWLRSGMPPLDQMALDMLRSQGLEPHDTPSAGRFVALRRIESTAWGGIDEEVTHSAHPDNIAAAIRATQLFGLEVAGVDMISQDITQAWHANGAVINEVNYAPLLGGGDISRRHIHAYFSRILKDNGKIPICILPGGEAVWAQAVAHWQQWRTSGVDAYLTSGAMTLDAQGNRYHMLHHSLWHRVQALLMQPDVGALVIVAQSESEAAAIRSICG